MFKAWLIPCLKLVEILNKVRCAFDKKKKKKLELYFDCAAGSLFLPINREAEQKLKKYKKWPLEGSLP